MDPIARLCEWYEREFTEDGHKDDKIVIATLGNLGWSIKINLDKTSSEGRSFQEIDIERSDGNWIVMRIKDKILEGFGGPGNLGEIIAAFLNWADHLPIFNLADELSPAEIEVVRRALQAAIEGEFFPDWEFQTLIGVDRDELREVHKAWPRQTLDDDRFACAVLGSLINLLGYPHGLEKEMLAYVPEGRDAMSKALYRVQALGVSDFL